LQEIKDDHNKEYSNIYKTYQESERENEKQIENTKNEE
jgi:hypothetical protein